MDGGLELAVFQVCVGEKEGNDDGGDQDREENNHADSCGSQGEHHSGS